ncbi:MAG: 1-acyl-sn-glycerol-3-phosphate acyltransferase [Alphaproteobacteria bacterium]|nr:1-acyl-sn-glycerol-3-phosphate acyltransferase [Alphaproteobacteria bacterium]NCQ87754.1 1-acyl-sn-glycerol-3-phosphate acyltransferase [Alphaproteobacteria bacterium]NCT05738.1 1-acyl-sn-glycerol-3-phosphate acyltransferase [Alphaproteobacteria bacterium]
MRIIIASIKLFLLAIICLITLPLLGLTRLFFMKTRFRYVVPKLFHGSICLIFGIRKKIKGEIVKGKQVLFIGNHLSYLDIPLLGSVLSATFISKEEVQKWPMLGLLATIAKTIFISRAPAKAAKALQQMKESIHNGTSLIVFPEGTSSSGEAVLPFKSSLFDIFLKEDSKNNMIIQPFTTNLVKVDTRPIQSLKDRNQYAWYGEMDLTPHLWAIAKSKGADLEITFHSPIDISSYDNRKILSKSCYERVVSGLMHQGER